MPDNNVETVKERTDIVALVGEQVRLTRTGANFKGLCPFHGEKTPSFIVSPTRQMYHCFGCSESGDVFSWLMKREGMTFPEALQVLAQRAGITLQYERSEKREEREKLRTALATVAEFYHNIFLQASAAADARAYLEKRSISAESIEAWGIGFVPMTETGLTRRASARGITAADLIGAGILAQGSRGQYERFRGRVIFPLRDHHGSPVGLAGRILKEDPNFPAAKYVNTPETALYRKSRFLYGLDKAKEAIRKEDMAVVVEGYTDVIASHQSGVKNVIATSGTALTPDQLDSVRRFTENITFCFDADSAGSEATRRAIDLALGKDFNVSVSLLPAGLDPADMAIQDPAGWAKAVAAPSDAFEFLITDAIAKMPENNLAAKKAVAAKLMPVLARVGSPVARGEYLQMLAARLQLDVRYLEEDFARYRAGAPAPDRPAASPNREEKRDPSVAKEERLMEIFFYFPDTIGIAADLLDPEMLCGTRTGLLYKEILKWYHDRQAEQDPLAVETLLGDLAEDLKVFAESSLLRMEVEEEEGGLRDPGREVRLLVREISSRYVKDKIKAATAALGALSASEKESAMERIAQLNTELAQIERIVA